MKDHFSHEKLLSFAERTLDVAETLAVSDHLGECESCRQDLTGMLEPERQASLLRNSLEFESLDQHLEFDMMSAYVDGGLDEIENEIVELHVGDCKECYSEVEEIRRLREEIQSSPSVAAIKYTAPSYSEQVRAFFSSGALRFVLPVLLFILVASAIYFVQRKSVDDGPIAAVNNVPPDANAGTPPIGPTDNTNSEVPSNAIQKAAFTLEDGSGELQLTADGKLAKPFAGEFDPRIETAIRTGNLSIAEEASRVKVGAGVLMGPGSGTSGLRVRYPIGKVLATNRPELRWSPVEGAQSYSVEIFDANYKKVAQSPPLTSEKWQVVSPLPRGREFTWQVTAVKDGESLRAPERPAPDAKFYVVSDEKTREIERAKRSYGNSHLVLGLVYADAGLLDEAEREFQALLRKNPNSEPVKRLLNKVKAAR